MKPGGGREKGHGFEREIAALFRSIPLWPEAKRGLQGRGGAEAADVEGTPFYLELKRGRQPNIRRAMEQSIADEKAHRYRAGGQFSYRPPVVISRADRAEALVTMRLDDWITLVCAAESGGEVSKLSWPKWTEKA